MSEAYYRKWRPLDWKSVIGQDHITTTIQNALVLKRVAHAYLFSGPRGTGKTSTARIVAKAVNCQSDNLSERPCNECEHCKAINAGRFLDMIEIDAASNTSVDDIRSLREKINFSPTQGEYKVYIIDEVHMLSNAAFNALLKTLEEPPNHAIFVLATTEVHKIPATVLSRCQRHEFRRIPINSIQVNLRAIADKEKIEIESDALTEIARQATGSMRDAVSLLDQLASTGKKVTLAYAKDVLGTAGNERVADLVRALMAADAGKGITIINQVLDGGCDPRQFSRQVVDYLRSLLLAKMGNIENVDAAKEEVEQIKGLAKQFDTQKLITAIDAFDRSAHSTSLGWQPGLQLELAFMHVISTRTIDTSETLQKENFQTNKKRPFTPKKIVKKEDFVRKETTQPKNSNKPAENRSDKKLVGNKQTNKRNIDLEKEGIQAFWKEIRTAAKSISPETGALLNSCKSAKMNRGKLVLNFSSSILQSKMKNGNNKENTRKAVKQITGKDIDIVCEVSGRSSDHGGVNQDGMIGAALSLGGKMTKEEKDDQGRKR